MSAWSTGRSITIYEVKELMNIAVVYMWFCVFLSPVSGDNVERRNGIGLWEGSITRRTPCAFDGIPVTSYKKGKPELVVVVHTFNASLLRLRKKD